MIIVLLGGGALQREVAVVHVLTPNDLAALDHGPAGQIAGLEVAVGDVTVVGGGIVALGGGDDFLQHEVIVVDVAIGGGTIGSILLHSNTQGGVLTGADSELLGVQHVGLDGPVVDTAIDQLGRAAGAGINMYAGGRLGGGTDVQSIHIQGVAAVGVHRNGLNRHILVLIGAGSLQHIVAVVGLDRTLIQSPAVGGAVVEVAVDNQVVGGLIVGGDGRLFGGIGLVAADLFQGQVVNIYFTKATGTATDFEQNSALFTSVKGESGLLPYTGYSGSVRSFNTRLITAICSFDNGSVGTVTIANVQTYILRVCSRIGIPESSRVIAVSINRNDLADGISVATGGGRSMQRISATVYHVGGNSGEVADLPSGKLAGFKIAVNYQVVGGEDDGTHGQHGANHQRRQHDSQRFTEILHSVFPP